MVRVVARFASNCPCIIPIETMIIDEQAHQFRDRNRRVRVIELDRVEIREFGPIAVIGKEATHDILQRATHEEILLHKTELLTIFRRVIRIQHLGDRLTHCLFANGFDITTIIEDVEIELARCFRIPQTQEINRFGTVTDDCDIIWNAFDGLLVDPHWTESALVIHVMLNTAVELYLLREVWPHHFPRAALFHPSIWMLNLVTVFELLTEQAELITNAIANRWQIQRREGIEETGRQATEATITEAHVGLFVSDCVKILAKLAECITCLLKQTRIMQVIDQQAAHQIL